VPFALPEHDAAFAEFLYRTGLELARVRSPLLSMIPMETIPSTVGSRIRTREGMDLDLEPSKQGFEITTSVDSVRNADFGALMAELDEAAEDLTKDMVEHFSPSSLAIPTTMLWTVRRGIENGPTDTRPASHWRAISAGIKPCR
jgi:hypothetical protein